MDKSIENMDTLTRKVGLESREKKLICNCFRTTLNFLDIKNERFMSGKVIITRYVERRCL